MDQLGKRDVSYQIEPELLLHKYIARHGNGTDKDKSLVINPSKLRSERERFRKEIHQEVSNFKFFTGLYFDSRKDATQVIVEESNAKMCRSTQLEEHYVLLGEPGTYYLTYLSSIDGKSHTLAQEIFEFISEIVLCEKLTIIGTDETASMTGKFNDAKYSIEELHKNSLQ